jgi:hypothetical protein
LEGKDFPLPADKQIVAEEERKKALNEHFKRV